MSFANHLKPVLITSIQLCSLGGLTGHVYAQADLNQIEQQQYNQYQQRLESFEDKTSKPFVNLSESTPDTSLKQPPLGESPCFNIYQVNLQLPDDPRLKREFSTILGPIKYEQGSILGHCIGQKGLNYAMRNVQNELIEQGFITTQAAIEPQDLTSGVLNITIIPGRLHKVWRSGDGHPKTNISNALTLSEGDLINLRDIETSLENFRLPQSAITNIDIIPSVSTIDNEQYGSSDLVVAQKRTMPIQWQLSIDDSGSADTGKYQGTVTTSIDNPLSANDALSLSYTHSIDPWNNIDKLSNNNSLYINYRYPYKKWQLQLFYSDYDFNQTLAGLNQDIIYKGKSNQSSVELQRLIHRDHYSKTSASLEGYHKNSKNYFDDQEIKVQRRRTSGWKAGIDHQRQTSLGDITASLQYQKGTGAFSAIKAPESFISEAESQPSIWSAQVSLRHPFNIDKSSYQYALQWRGQYSPQSLTPQDQFIVGGRYTTKGLSDEQSLSGENGMLLQQEMARIVPLTGQVTLMPYMTLDQGWVGGDSTEYLAGNYLMSTSVGARLYANNISIDGFVGKGLQAPRSIDKDTTGGFRITIYN
ncbi:ShlB/FhaC/HecB family hemolysin secretion/activation protein [Psychrobacter proteolyticus]|uniref:ShlB/FhaC/HecB family hemolysin secretion/activation protein n=1 Tax=Psychrobacter proteolyticus TaxID=147825 RepID=UPI00311F2CCC